MLPSVGCTCVLGEHRTKLLKIDLYTSLWFFYIQEHPLVLLITYGIGPFVTTVEHLEQDSSSFAFLWLTGMLIIYLKY